MLRTEPPTDAAVAAIPDRVSLPARGLPRRQRNAPDDTLVQRIRSGDERAFEAVFDRYHRPLLGFCRHMLGDHAEAEDALQQVFVSAHRALLADDAAIQLKPWLYAIARNRCLSVLRARRETVALDGAVEPSTDGLALAEEVERRQELRAVLGDVTQLPDEQRAALLLAELGDLSHDEIAMALDVRRDKVKALVFQARESLISSRNARGADCREIQEQLATLTGGALRRGPLRRHVAICPACAAFKDDVQRQRAALGCVLPVVPGLALKSQVLGAVFGGGAGAAGAAATTAAVAGAGAAATTGTTAAVGGGASSVLAAAGSAGAATKVVVASVLAAGALGGGVAVVRHDTAAPVHHAPAARPAATHPTTASPAKAGTAGATTGGKSAGAPGHHGKPHPKGPSTTALQHRAPGAQVTGQANRAPQAGATTGAGAKGKGSAGAAHTTKRMSGGLSSKPATKIRRRHVKPVHKRVVPESAKPLAPPKSPMAKTRPEAVTTTPATPVVP